MFNNQSRLLWACAICAQAFRNPKEMLEHLTAKNHFLSESQNFGWQGPSSTESKSIGEETSNPKENQ